MSVVNVLKNQTPARLMAIAMAVVVSVLADCSFAGERVGDDQGVRRYGLRNGLEIVVIPSGTGSLARTVQDPMIQFWLMVDAGTAQELDQERGIAQVAGAYLRDGISGFDEKMIDDMLLDERELEEYGTRARGVQILFDQALFTGQASRGDTVEINSLLSYYARVLEPGAWAISNARFERHRDWLHERVEQINNPMMAARQRWLQRLFGNGVLGTRLDLPELEEVDSLTVEDLEAFIERVYRPSRSTLVVVGDPSGLDLDSLIGQTLGRLPALEPGAAADVTMGLERSPSVFEYEPGWDLHQAVLIWSDDLDEDLSGEDSIRSYMIGRVATEIVRRRIERLGLASLGRDCEISVDRFELGNRVRLIQCVIQREGTSDEAWQESVGLLLAECERLVQHGVGREEMIQARGALLAGWHRDAEAWGSMTSREQAGDLFWLVMTGRSVIGSPSWDSLATRMMSTISDAEINAALRTMFDPDLASVLISCGGDERDPQVGQIELERFIREAKSVEYAALDPQWMQNLGGELLTGITHTGSIDEITQHAPSGTWGGVLGNGVRVWSRTVENNDRVELCATVYGTLFTDGSLSEAEISAAMLAWSEPSTEQRDTGWLAVYQDGHALDIRVQRIVRGIRISVEAPSDHAHDAMDFLFALLDRPMIDAGVFDRWSKQVQTRLGDEDPLDRGFALMYNPDLLDREDVVVSLDDAQRALTRIVHHGSIDIALSGDIDPAGSLERLGSLFGMLTERELVPQSQTPSDQSKLARERRARVEGLEPGVIFGVRGGPMNDLASLRAIILASIVLDGKIQEEMEQHGFDDSGIDAQVVMSDALGDRWALIVRVRGEDLQQREELVRSLMDQLASEGVDEPDLLRAQEYLIGSIDRYFDRAGYWSTRLSSLGVHGRSVDDLWGIREGYASVSSEQATGVLRRTLSRADWFRVDVEPSAR